MAQLLQTDATHSPSLVAAADIAWNAARESVFSLAQIPLSSVAEKIIVGFVFTKCLRYLLNVLFCLQD